MSDAAEIEKLLKLGCGLYSDMRVMPDGAFACVARFMFTYAIIYDVNDWGYEDRWCYHSYEDARDALERWDGQAEPTGWHRHPSSGWRVNEDGTIGQY